MTDGRTKSRSQVGSARSFRRRAGGKDASGDAPAPSPPIGQMSKSGRYSRRPGVRIELSDSEETTEKPKKPVKTWPFTLVLGFVVIGIGAYLTFARLPPAKAGIVLDDVSGLITQRKYDQARRKLTRVERIIDRVDSRTRGKFHALQADLSYETDFNETNPWYAVSRQVSTSYVAAIEDGWKLSEEQTKRLVKTAVVTESLTSFCERLQDSMDQRGEGREGAFVNLSDESVRILARQVVEVGMHEKDVPLELLENVVNTFAAHEESPAEHRLWVTQRQSEMLIAMGQPERAVSILREGLEHLSGDIEEEQEVGLRLRLAEGFLELGDIEKAEGQLDRAGVNFDASRSLWSYEGLLRAYIAFDQGDVESAFAIFDEIVQSSTGTNAWLPALLGRAEVQSVLGNQDASRTDFRDVIEHMKATDWRRDFTSELVARRLCERSDSEMSQGRLSSALQFVTMAESMLTDDSISPEVLLRMASLNRQLADDHMVHVQREPADTAVNFQRAATHYFNAGWAFELLARYWDREKTFPEHFATSLWSAADNYDHAGRQDMAGQLYHEYMEECAVDGSSRAMSLFHIAQSHHAQANVEPALSHYEILLAEYPRSPYAARTYVPLAQVYLMADRKNDAEELLIDVLRGNRLLEPVSHEFRRAEVELGKFYFASERYAESVELLLKAIARSPKDPNAFEWQFLVADGYRRHALTTESATHREDYFNRAHKGFDDICKSTISPKNVRFVHVAFIHRVDCSFRLNEFSRAIQECEHAAAVLTKEEPALYALLLKFNAHASRADWAGSAQVTEQILEKFQQMNAGAFTHMNSFMNQSEWARWFDLTRKFLTHDSSFARTTM